MMRCLPPLYVACSGSLLAWDIIGVEIVGFGTLFAILQDASAGLGA